MTLTSPELPTYAPNKVGICRHCGQGYYAHDHRGLGMTCATRAPRRVIKEFTTLHDKGSERFGTLWLSVNTDVVREARAHGFNPDGDMMLRTLLVRLAWRICEAYDER